MRNLPQSLATHVGSPFKSDGRSSDESYESTIYPAPWPMSSQAHGRKPEWSDASRPAHSRMTSRSGARLHIHDSRSNKRTNVVCATFIKHRVRILLMAVSLVFLSLFLLVIYRQFGLVVFASTLTLIVVPGLVALAYAKRLNAKEQEEARQRALNRGQSQRGASQRQHKTVQIYSTDVEMAPTVVGEASTAAAPVPKLQRKATQQKITIQLPATLLTDQ